MNRPIYVQKGIPIVPDFEARRPSVTNIQAVTSLQPPTLPQKRQLMLKLINELRDSHNVAPVYLDSKLNKFAQDYAE